MPSRKEGIEAQPFLSNYSDEFIKSEEPAVPYRRESRGSAIKSYAVVAVITSLLWMLIMLLTTPNNYLRSGSRLMASRHNITTGSKYLSCGECADEARELGCKYDILLNNWVPEPCYDQEFIDEYTDVESASEVRATVDVVLDALHNPHKPRPKGEVIVGEIARQ